MKNLSPKLILSLLVLSALPIIATAQDFEGVIYYQIPEMQKQGMSELPYMIKNSKVRIDFGEGQSKGAMIMLPEKAQMTYILDQQKIYMSMDLDKQMLKADEDEGTPEVNKTGETKMIAGQKCEVWRVQSKDGTTEACMAKGMGTFMMPHSPMARKQTPQWARELMEDGAMPLEVYEINGDKRTLQMKATKIEKKSLDDDLFEIPSGYRDMSSMMKQMMNRGNK